MKENYKKLDNREIEKLISIKMQELIALRNELSKRMGEEHQAVNYDFTQRVNDC